MGHGRTNLSKVIKAFGQIFIIVCLCIFKFTTKQQITQKVEAQTFFTGLYAEH